MLLTFTLQSKSGLVFRDFTHIFLHAKEPLLYTVIIKHVLLKETVKTYNSSNIFVSKLKGLEINELMTKI